MGHQEKTYTTHENDLMIEDHRTIAAVHIGKRILYDVGLWEELLILQDGSYVGITLPNVGLPCGKMTIDETDRRVVDDETRNDASLRSSQKRTTYMHSPRRTLFPYRPPIPLFIVVIATCLSDIRWVSLTKMQLKSPTKVL